MKIISIQLCTYWWLSPSRAVESASGPRVIIWMWTHWHIEGFALGGGREWMTQMVIRWACPRKNKSPKLLDRLWAIMDTWEIHRSQILVGPMRVILDLLDYYHRNDFSGWPVLCFHRCVAYASIVVWQKEQFPYKVILRFWQILEEWYGFCY